ncbi:MAG TPA: DUF1579 domain-containing protein [Flavisolibacter sp.]|nr:DUF1579 domain-containing protein [Flavisolibacter sp.]
MKHFTITICTAALLFACKGNDKKADEAKKDETAVAAASTTQPSNQAIPDSVVEKNWMKYMTPSKEHALMASWDGTWNGEVSVWMKPGTDPSKSTTVTTNKMVLGGRYQQSTHKGSFNGMPFEGMSTLAFDNAKKVFLSTWIDNMGTGIMTGEGTWDDATQSITLKGKVMDPGQSKDVDYREVFTVIDKDHQRTEMYGINPTDGKEFKTMEIKFTRKK